MSWEEDLIGERTVESTFDTPSNEKVLSIADYVKMSDDELLKALNGTLHSLGVLEELQKIGENEEEAVKVAYDNYWDIKNVLLNRKLKDDLDSTMKDIDAELLKKFKKLGVQQDKETSDENRQQ